MNRSRYGLLALPLYLLTTSGCGVTADESGEEATDATDEALRNCIEPFSSSLVRCPIDEPEPEPVCAYGRADCDGYASNGCEVILASNVNHCGSCGDACPSFANATRTCSAGTCGYTCASGFSDCDGNPANGCETSGACGAACTIAAERELFITDPRVVDDPARTTGTGAWTFGRLMTDMAGPQDVQTFVRTWLNSWRSNQTVNTFTVAARSRIQDVVITPWERVSPTGTLDLTRAPFRLLAIVNRIDLRNGAASAGEGRFVFGLIDADGRPVSPEFTVIFEYTLPISSTRSLAQWAQGWHALGATPFGAAYNAQLQALTDGFAGRNALPSAVNGSAISQVRTNERAIGVPWELREFKLSSSGMLAPAPTQLTPHISFNNTQRLADFILQNQVPISTEAHTVPVSFQGSPFLAGAAPVPSDNTGFRWAAPGIPEDLRAKFSRNTCNGCHAGETGTSFLHVVPRAANTAAVLSSFVTGTELPRRSRDLASLVCATTRLAPVIDDEALPCPSGFADVCHDDVCRRVGTLCP